MDRAKLKVRIEKIKELYPFDFGETQAKKSIIEPIFDKLDWDTSDPKEVVLEYPTPSGSRVDYAFCRNGEPIVLIEAKKPNEPFDNHAEQQILKYAFDKGVSLAILINGIDWWFYLALEKGDWETRKFYSIDLGTQEIDSVCDRFIEFLSKDNVISNRAVENAKKMRKSRERLLRTKQTLPEAWNDIITEPNEILVELLIEETERRCGFKPDVSQIKDFLGKVTKPPEPITLTKPLRPQRYEGSKEKPDEFLKTTPMSFMFLGETIRVTFWYDILINICKIMREKHSDNFEEVIFGLHGNKHRYFSRDRRELMQRQGKKIPGTDIYAATKLSAPAMVERCRLVVQSFGYNPDDLKIHTLDS